MTNMGGIGHHGSYVGKRAEMSVIDEAMPKELLEHIKINKQPKVVTGCQLCDYIWRNADDFTDSAMFIENQAAICMKDGKPWLYTVHRWGDIIWHKLDVTEVNYCPKCGRKLV